MITEANQIYIFGVGSSGNTGNDLEAMLRVGVQSRSVIDLISSTNRLLLLTEKDLVIGFSLSGRIKDTHDSLNIAKKIMRRSSPLQLPTVTYRPN